MTDRIHSLTVCFERDMREDDAQAIIQAIQMVKGVLRAEPHISNPATWMAEQRAIRALGEKVLNAVQGKVE